MSNSTSGGHVFTLKAKIANLPPEVIKRILESAVSFYMEEGFVEEHPEYAALTDDESCDWKFEIEEQVT